MNEKKSRALLFALGITIGLLVGATVVYVSSPKPNSNGEVSENMIEQIVNKVYGLVSSKKEANDSLSAKAETPDKNSKNKEVLSAKSNEKATSQVIDSSSIVASNAQVTNDSLSADSAASGAVAMLNLNDEIIIKKDELLVTKMVDLINLDFASAKQNNHTDSLLQTASGIRDNSKLSLAKYSYQVELWKSPINYKGYKMAKNKLVLYGLDQEVPLKLFYLNDNTYLKYSDTFFKLDNYNDYKAFEKVLNPQVIALLNK